MSNITNLVLVVSLADDENVPLVDAWLKSKSTNWYLSKDLSEDIITGGKVLEVQVHIAALNGFWAEQAFKEFISSLEWDNKSAIVLCPQNGPAQAAGL